MGKIKSYYYEQYLHLDDPDEAGPADEDYYGAAHMEVIPGCPWQPDALITRTPVSDKLVDREPF